MRIFTYFNILFFLLFISKINSNEGPLQYPEPPDGWDEGDCKSLQIQSPIDIPSLKDESIIIDNGYYAKIKSLLYNNIFSGSVKFDNNHKWTTEELDIGYIEIYLNTTLYKYKLHSFHFHLYSEHRIENKQYPMELHIVHKNMNKKDLINENLVIGILFDYKNDKENQFLKKINLGEEKKINDASILDLINKKDSFYYYKGSLTTIPCTENVNWIIFKDIKNMSYQQFIKFKNWIENSNLKYYGVGYGNARGPKRLNGRKIYLENYDRDNINSTGKYWFSIFPITTFLLYPLLIFYYHMQFKNKIFRYI
jgi:carbonic anhydrase